jgi:hypothetical protein
VSDDAPIVPSGPAEREPGAVPTSPATIFVSDPSAEAEHLAQLLRGSGFVVVDVPLSLLVARAEVQPPNVVILDADAVGAMETAAALRSTEGCKDVGVLLVGQEPQGEGPDGAPLAGTSSWFFARPVDAAALVSKIAAFTGGPSSGAPAARPASSSSAPPKSPPLSARSLRAEATSDAPALSLRSAVSIRTALSPEIAALLSEAEHRASAQMMHDGPPPTPEEEIEAVLPAALLAELDDPIEEDDDLSDALGGLHPSAAFEGDAGAGRPHASTNSGRALTPPPEGVEGSGDMAVASTMAPPPMLLAHDPLQHDGALMDLQMGDASPSTDDQPRAGATALGTLGVGAVVRALAAAVASRTTGCYSFLSPERGRSVVLRDGDVVTAASTADDESLVAFMASRGDLRREHAKDLLGKIPAFGRHAGAALIGHGLLRQDQLWPILRSHAEWLVGRTLTMTEGTAEFEVEAPGRLQKEPSVFGGSSGAEVLVEAARRVITPEDAVQRLGGPGSVVVDGPTDLLAECALDAIERGIVEESRGVTLEDLVARAPSSDIAAALYILHELGVVAFAESPSAARSRGGQGRDAPTEDGAVFDHLDVAAIRERVRARRDLVAEADYFTLLGVSRDATGYEVRRAYLELRRAFDPSRILTPEIADLQDDVKTIVVVLDEAYDILRDTTRRERYARALGDIS